MKKPKKSVDETQENQKPRKMDDETKKNRKHA